MGKSERKNSVFGSAMFGMGVATMLRYVAYSAHLRCLDTGKVLDESDLLNMANAGEKEFAQMFFEEFPDIPLIYEGHMIELTTSEERRNASDKSGRVQRPRHKTMVDFGFAHPHKEGMIVCVEVGGRLTGGRKINQKRIGDEAAKNGAGIEYVQISRADLKDVRRNIKCLGELLGLKK